MQTLVQIYGYLANGERTPEEQQVDCDLEAFLDEYHNKYPSVKRICITIHNPKLYP